MVIPNLLPVREFSNKHPQFSEASLRYHIFRAKQRKDTTDGEVKPNGMEECGALVRVGRRVLINEEKFFEWIMNGGADQ